MSAVARDFDFETMSLRHRDFQRVSRPRVETYSYVADDVRPTNLLLHFRGMLPLFTFSVDGEIKRLRQPLMLRVTIEDGEYFTENDALRLFGNGKTLAAALQAFYDDLAYYWQYYRALPDDQVAGDGEALKRLYQELVAA